MDEYEIVEASEFYELANEDEFVKSNMIISSLYKSTANENKILAVALNRIRDAYEDKEGSLIVSVKGNELKNILQLHGNSLYDSLDKIAQRMTGGRTIGVSDLENERFMYVPLITKAAYENGTFSLRFAPEMKKYLKSLEDNYTILSLTTMLEFKSVYSIRLYEILKSQCYTPKWKNVTNNNKFKIEMSLSQLKLELGVVNAELAKTKAILLNNSHNGVPDYDQAVKTADEKMYERWYEFKRNCLDKAIAEINEKTEMKVEYEKNRAGIGGKTQSLIFYVTIEKGKLEELENEANLTMERFENDDDFLEAIIENASEPIKISEARAIMNASKKNFAEIVKAEKYIKSLSKKPDNYVAYMIDTLKHRYYESDKRKRKDDPEEKETTPAKKKNPTLTKDDIEKKMTE